MRPYSAEWYEHHRGQFGETACRNLGDYAIPDDLKLSVGIPVFNEAGTVRELPDRVLAIPIKKQLILVDVGSVDQSLDFLKDIQQSFQ